MTAEGWVALAALVIGIISTLIGLIFRELATKVHDIEQKTLTRELFKIHQTHVNDRFSRQDRVLAEQTLILRKLDRDRRARSEFPSSHEIEPPLPVEPDADPDPDHD